MIKRSHCYPNKWDHFIRLREQLLVVENLVEEQYLFKEFMDVVRKDPQNFPEWHASSLKLLYSPPVFENKKKDTGYWF